MTAEPGQELPRGLTVEALQGATARLRAQLADECTEEAARLVVARKMFPLPTMRPAPFVVIPGL